MIAVDHHPHHHQARNRKEPLIPKQTDEDDEMIEVLSVVGDVTNIMTIDAKSFVEVATGGGDGGGVSSPSDGSTSSGVRPRKRAKLDHLSSEEKAQHRKMMNRISAQSARDRQKCLMQQQEVEIKGLTSVNENLKSENEVLNSKCANLVAENERLSKLLSQYEQKMKSSVKSSSVVEPVIKKEHIEDSSEMSGKLEKDVSSSLEPAEGTRAVEKLLLPTTSLDVFTMDLDAPELIQALDDFTKQILSPAEQLSVRLEEAIASSNPTDAAVDEICQIEEGPRVGGRAEEEEEEEEAKKVAQLVATLQLQFPSIGDSTFAMSSSNDTENSLPIQEPDFQILSEMFDEYNNNTDHNSKSQSPPESPVMDHIPIASHWDSLINNDNSNKAKTELSCFLESYPYDSWDSPGSVESEIFPELSI